MSDKMHTSTIIHCSHAFRANTNRFHKKTTLRELLLLSFSKSVERMRPIHTLVYIFCLRLPVCLPLTQGCYIINTFFFSWGGLKNLLHCIHTTLCMGKRKNLQQEIIPACFHSMVAQRKNALKQVHAHIRPPPPDVMALNAPFLDQL